jgi:tetratricopeptide (TPR) repeat protein
MTPYSISRSVLLTATLLSACAAANPSPSAGPTFSHSVLSGRYGPSGAFADFLTGQFASSENDLDFAAVAYLHALAADPSDPDLLQEAFRACLLTDRKEAVRLAHQLPDNPAAQLLLADEDASAGHWDAAERRFRALPAQGPLQILQPLLIAWAQQGAGRTDAALATLRPHIEGTKLRGVYALHAALMADLAGRTAEAQRLYSIAESDQGAINLRLAQILASWQMRQGLEPEAEKTLSALNAGEELGMAVPALAEASRGRAIGRATDGIAEAYLALAGSIRQQEGAEFSLVLLRLALDLRPDLTAARLLLAESMDNGHHPEIASRILSDIPATDPLIAIVQLHRASLAEREGNTDQALRLLDELAADYPTRPEPLVQKGDLLRSKNRFPEAIAAYSDAIERAKPPAAKDWPLFYARAIAYERSHQWPEAQTDFQEALTLAPDQPYVLNYLGYSWTERDENLADAKEMIERAAALRPNDGAIVDSLGWVLLRQGDSAGAVKQLEHAVELQPEDPTINGHLGDAYWAVGRRLEARYQWNRALTLNPEPEDLARIEGRLKQADASIAPAKSEP